MSLTWASEEELYQLREWERREALADREGRWPWWTPLVIAGGLWMVIVEGLCQIFR